MPDQSRRRPVRPVLVTIWSLLTASAAGVGMWAVMAGGVDGIRADTFGAGGAEPVLPVGDLMFGLAFGGLILGWLLSRIAFHGAAEVLSDRFGRPVAWVGATVGAVVAARLQRTPAHVGIGYATDPDARWQWYDWLLYALPVVVPVVLAVKTVFSIRRVARKISELRLRRDGTLTRAAITEVDFRNLWIWDKPVFRVTFTFVSATGSHTATRRLTTTPEEAPIVGGTVKVWYDPDSPDPERISMDRDPDSPTDPENAKRYAPPPD